MGHLQARLTLKWVDMSRSPAHLERRPGATAFTSPGHAGYAPRAPRDSRSIGVSQDVHLELRLVEAIPEQQEPSPSRRGRFHRSDQDNR